MLVTYDGFEKTVQLSWPPPNVYRTVVPTGLLPIGEAFAPDERVEFTEREYRLRDCQHDHARRMWRLVYREVR